ncbi:hypothetical protein EYB66_05275 [Akkermansia muciniphila]|uniref:hypothetical protein n=2 Tax=Akkermansia muciniphila TaxID=239935 RepID=UPI0010348072|nr:hypothetical protein [Akkermansia muciniphila]QBH16716.1 hypothetical protein EYB66_05275 [Akkermansia muciniphila]QWP64840.1 hypothetical protein J5W61_06645 [Akkermansia muciniphila]
MWVKVSIAALVIALLGGAMYYLDNEEALTKERRECASRYKNLNGLRGEFTEEKTKYVDFLVKNEALTNDINALTKEKDELEVKNQELASANEAKKSDLQTQQTALAELQSKSKDMESIQAIADRIKGLEEESKQLEVVKQAEQGKHDAIVAETEQLVVNNAALRQLKADQDARLSPPNLKTRVSQVIHDFNVVVIDGGAVDLGVVPGSKLAVMRDGNKIAELDVNAVESRVSTATILPSTVTAGERVEAGDVVVSVRP